MSNDSGFKLDRRLDILYRHISSDPRICHLDLRIFIKLCYYSNSKKGYTCFPSVETICNQIGIIFRNNETRIYSSLKKLEAYGYIRIQKRFLDGKKISNLYEILPADAPEKKLSTDPYDSYYKDPYDSYGDVPYDSYVKESRTNPTDEQCIYINNNNINNNIGNPPLTEEDIGAQKIDSSTEDLDSNFEEISELYRNVDNNELCKKRYQRNLQSFKHQELISQVKFYNESLSKKGFTAKPFSEWLEIKWNERNSQTASHKVDNSLEEISRSIEESSEAESLKIFRKEIIADIGIPLYVSWFKAMELSLVDNTMCCGFKGTYHYERVQRDFSNLLKGKQVVLLKTA